MKKLKYTIERVRTDRNGKIIETVVSIHDGNENAGVFVPERALEKADLAFMNAGDFRFSGRGGEHMIFTETELGEITSIDALNTFLTDRLATNPNPPVDTPSPVTPTTPTPVTPEPPVPGNPN